MTYFNTWKHFFPAVPSAKFLYAHDKAVAGLNAIKLVESNDILYLGERHLYTIIMKVYMERSK